MSFPIPENEAINGLPDGLYCSAGSSYFMILPNGDVYRCMSDHLNGGEIYFNVKNGWISDTALNACPYNICTPRCDIDWTSRFLVKNGVSKKDGETVNNAYYISEKKKVYAPHIMWFPTFVCNYTCNYCPCGKGKASIIKEMRSSSPELSVEEWISAWIRILDQYDYATVDISGGEPMISPALIPVLQIISKKFSVAITTNASQNAMVLGRDGITLPSERDTQFGKFKRGLNRITCSLHPTSRGFEINKYKGNILYMKSLGIDVSISFVGYPTQLFLAEEYKEWAERHGIGFNMLPWRGVDNFGYSTNYNQEQEKFILNVGGRYTTPEFFNKGDYSYDISTEDIIFCNAGDNLKVKGTVKNTGKKSWKSDEIGKEYKVGFRLFQVGIQKGREQLREFRATLPPEIPVNSSASFEVNIPTNEFSSGNYTLTVDVVKERDYWLSQRGATERTVMVLVRE